MNLYHYTSINLLSKILKEGLKIGSHKNTLDGVQLGIYLTTDPNMNFYETLPDTLFDKNNDQIVRIEIDSSLYSLTKLDKEFHQFENREEELETFGHLMLYIDRDIDNKSIISNKVMHIRNTRSYSLFGEI